MVTRITTVVFLYHQPEDGRNTGTKHADEQIINNNTSSNESAVVSCLYIVQIKLMHGILHVLQCWHNKSHTVNFLFFYLQLGTNDKLDIYGLSKHSLRQKIPTPRETHLTHIKLFHLCRMCVHVPTVDMQVSLTSILHHLDFNKGSMKKGLFYNIHFIFITLLVFILMHLNSWRIKDQLDITCYFISLLMCSTCFGH